MKKGLKVLSLIMSLIMILSATMVSTVSAAGSEPQYPNNANFSWGIAGHLATSSYNKGDIEAQVALAAKLGVKIYSVDGNAITPELDKLVKTANAYGLDVMLTITNGYNKTTQEVTDYFGKVARHYATGYFGTVKYIKIFNETDNLCLIDGRSGKSADSYTTADVQAMAGRISAAYNAIKAVSSNFVTIVNHSWQHQVYLNMLRNNGANWDVTGLSWYTNMQTEATNGLSTALSNLNSYSSLSGKSVIITESNVHGGGAATNQDLLNIMSTAYNSNKVIGMCFYELLDEPDMVSGENAYGFVNYTNANGIGAVKAKYTTVQGLIGGSDSIVKGTYTPAAGYPSGSATYTRAADFDNNIALMGGTTGSNPNAGTIEFGEAYNMYDYDAFEFDMYVESTTADAVSYNVMLQDASWGSRKTTLSNIPVNQWVHKVIYIDSFLNYGGNPNAVVRFAVENSNTNTVVNVVNASFVTGVSPAVNNTWFEVKKLDYKMFITGTNEYGRTQKTESSVVNMSSGYLEFDMYTDSTSNFQIQIVDTNGKKKVKILNANGNTNQWIHQVVPVTWSSGTGFGYGDDDCDKSNINRVRLDNISASNTYLVTNLVLTKDTPDRNTVHQVAQTFDLDFTTNVGTSLNGNSRYTISASKKSLGASYDAKNNYLAFEFDVYVTSSGTADTPFTFNFCNSSDGNRYYHTGVTVPVNQWVHKVLYMENFQGAGTDVAKIYLDGSWVPDPGSKIRIMNCAFVTAPTADYVNEPVQYTNYKLKAKSNATLNGNNKYTISTTGETSIGGTYNATNYLAYEFDVFAESTGTEDVPFTFNFRNSSNQNRYYHTGVSVPANQWVHKVLYISNFAKENGSSGTDVAKVYLDGSRVPDPNTTIRIVNGAFVNIPSPNYVHEAAQTFNFELTGTSSASPNGEGTYAISANRNLGATYNAKNYLAYEFDAFVTSTGSEDVNIKVGFQNSSNQSFIHFDVVIPANKWTHKILYIKDFRNYGHDGTAATKVYFDGKLPNASTNVRIINSAFVNLPSANYEHYLALDLDADYDRTRSTGTGGTFATGQTDFTRYDYVEFDFFAENIAAAKNVRIWFKNQTTNQKGFYDVTVAPGASWTHYAVPVNDINCQYSWNSAPKGDRTTLVAVDLTNDYVAEGEHYKIINMALTTTEEPVGWGDANGDGFVNILDLICMKKIAAEIEGYEYNEVVDFNQDYMIDAEDIAQMISYLIGEIDSLEPTE